MSKQEYEERFTPGRRVVIDDINSPFYLWVGDVDETQAIPRNKVARMRCDLYLKVNFRIPGIAVFELGVSVVSKLTLTFRANQLLTMEEHNERLLRQAEQRAALPAGSGEKNA